MKIGLIDNDYSTRDKHNFPNLALMKLSNWHKKKGDDVRLVNFDIINPNSLFPEHFDKIYVAKVFTDTPTPQFIYQLKNLEYGGSGFFYDMAPRLPEEIEHTKPDYNLYKDDSQYYKNFSIGFITRGCIRKCAFCINRNYSKVEFNTSPNEFIDYGRPYVMLLDDNITAYKHFEEAFKMLNDTGKNFVFKQGMDFRLLTEKKMEILWNSNYYSTSKKGQNDKGGRVFHFAFDNIADYDLIEKKLKQYYYTKPYAFVAMFYVLCGFDRQNKYDNSFFESDFDSILKRVALLFKYNAEPYIMMHENVKLSPYKNFIYDLRLLLRPNNIQNYSKGIEYCCLVAKKHELLNLLKTKHSWFLDCKYETRLYRCLNKD